MAARRDMTTGNIWKEIFLFSIPLLLGNLFQLLYNTIDSIVVGQYVGKTALAAVGASAPIINLVIGFFMGLATGAGVVVSRFFGGKHYEDMSKAIHTFVLFSIIVGCGLMVLGVTCSPYLLKAIGTPGDVFNQANDYLTIYFAGSLFICLYNAGTGILQAIGDSKRPLYFLGISSVVNILLDLLFVTQLKMGVVGVAYATLIAQGVSCALVIIVLVKTKDVYKIHISKLRIDFYLLKKIIKIGIPAGVQAMIVSLSNVVVQAYINNFGSATIAGFSSANKFDNFLGLPVNSFALAITTFTGQNLGAKQYDRVKKGVHATLIMSISTVVVLGLATFTFAESCISIFSQEKDVIEAGAKLIRIMCPFYFALCLHQVYSGALRASGRSSIPMYTSIIAFVVTRQIYLSIVMPIYNDIAVVGWGYSLTWLFAAILTGTYYFGSRWLRQEEKRV